MKTVSSSGHSCGSPTAMVEGGGGGGGEEGGGGGGGGGGGAQNCRLSVARHWAARCPDLRQRRQRTGSRQEAALWSLAKHLKQRPSVARWKAHRAAVGGRLE
jgi:hypothetical protein